jgi:hypothetical protein
VLELDVEPASRDATTGIVGARQLVCVQTFDVARLTTHPVVLRPGSFVAVGGRGPRGDSNESGKTSFLAATALLLGDPEWRMTGGGPAAAASLLFEPETAGVSAHTYAAAREGFIIGVFTEPERPAEVALTVWCRINATNPYFQVRYADGVHLVEGDSDRERHLAADSGWESMPARTQLGAHHYAERLYGDSPRCLAYVARRGKQRSAPSLLQMNAGGFSPERIGEDLIHLTGRAAAFENESGQRQRLDEAQRALADRQRTDERARDEEETQLAGVLARNSARGHLAQAEDVWRLHFARGYLDVLERERELTAERDEVAADASVREASVADAQAELNRIAVPDELRSEHAVAEDEASRLRGKREGAVQADAEARVAVTAANKHVHELDQAADGWTSPTAERIVEQLATARTAAEEAQQLLGVAKRLRGEAEERVRAAEAGVDGRAGATVQLLRESGIVAAPLMDVELAGAARPVWESRLALYEPAVVVAPGRIEDALRAVSGAPGTVLIAGEDGDLPDGIVSAPAGAAGFLSRLVAVAEVAHNPLRAEQHALGVVVIGDFPEPQTGRAARLESATRSLEQACEGVAEQEGAARQASLEVERQEGDLRRARAAEQLIEAREKLQSARDAAFAAKRALDDLTQPLAEAEQAHLSLAARLEGYELALNAAKERVESCSEQHRLAKASLREAQRRLDNLQVEYWCASWGDTEESAEAALVGERRTEKRLRNRAAELLQDALGDLDIRSDGSGAPTEELALVARRRNLIEEDPERGRVPATLQEVVRPLRDFLDAHHDQDLVTEERVTRARERRAAELELAVEETQRLDSALATLQDGVEQRIRQALDAISAEYDRLNRESGWFGADLHIDARRPDGPTDHWRWSVTPRWKRSANGRPLPYDNQANTAQEKLATVQLVLAALLAAPNPRGRVLVLDELGDSLGVSHRREVLREIASTAQSKGVTVLGTCQDSVMADAAHHCGELIYFDYPSHEDALNRPTRMFGFDDNRLRVELTADALRNGRPVI